MLSRNGTLPGERPSWPKASLTRLLSELEGSALTRAQSNVGVSHSPLRSAVTDREKKDQGSRRRSKEEGAVRGGVIAYSRGKAQLLRNEPSHSVI